MATTKYDQIFLGILKEERNLLPFLDVVFGFLYRCTDFYQIQHEPNEKLGFPPGIAETIVVNVLKKWQTQAREDQGYEQRLPSCDEVPPAIQEVEISDSLPEETQSLSISSTQPDDQDKNVTSTEIQEEETTATNGSQEKNIQQLCQSTGDTYNGAVCEGYRWSQSIMDVDVQVPVPVHIKKGRSVRVNLTSSSLTVCVLDENVPAEWRTLIDGELCLKTNKEESVWSLVPSQYVHLHLEKAREQWWDALFTSEPKINLRQIDSSRPIDDLPQEEQMKIQELMWNQERKRQGLSTSENLKMEKILKEAWNKEGSPFKGQAYDPKQINFGGTVSSHDNYEDS